MYFSFIYGTRPQKVTNPYSLWFSIDVEILGCNPITVTLKLLHSVSMEKDNHTDLFCKML